MLEQTTRFTCKLIGLALFASPLTGCLNYPRNGQSLPTKTAPVQFQGYGGTGVQMIPEIFNTATAGWEAIPLNAPLVTGGTPYVDSVGVSWYPFDNPNVSLPAGSQYWFASPNGARTISTRVRVKDTSNNLLNTFDEGVSSSNCPYTTGYEVINHCKSSEGAAVTLTVPCGSPGATCCLSGQACTYSMMGHCGAGGMCPALASSQWDTFSFKPAGTENPLVIQVQKSGAPYSNGAYRAPVNTPAFISCAGGITLPLMVTSLTLTSPAQNPAQITAITGSLGAMPDFGGVTWPGALAGMKTLGAGGPLSFSATTGQSFNSKGLPLQVKATRNFFTFQPPAGQIPLVGFGNAVMSSLQNGMSGEVNILIDPVAPGVAFYGSMNGKTFIGLDAGGVGISANRDFHFEPLVSEDLEEGDIPSFDGAMFLSASATIRGVTVTGSAVADVGTSLAHPGPVKLGINGSATVSINIVPEFGAIDLTIAEGSYFHQFGTTEDHAAFDGIVGGDALKLSGFGYEIALADYFSTLSEARVFGVLAYHDGTLDPMDSHATLKAHTAVLGGMALPELEVSVNGQSGVMARAEINTAFADVEIEGRFSSSGVVLTGTGSINASVSASVPVVGGISASVTGVLYAEVATNGASYAVLGGGKLSVCALGKCTDVAANVSKVGQLPRVCVPDMSFKVTIPEQCTPGVCLPGLPCGKVCSPSYTHTVKLGSRCFNP